MNQKELRDVADRTQVDGLGLCRRCGYLSGLSTKYNVNEYMAIGSGDYSSIQCKKKLAPCYLVRNSLITCTFFKYRDNPIKNLQLWIARTFLSLLGDKNENRSKTIR